MENNKYDNLTLEEQMKFLKRASRLSINKAVGKSDTIDALMSDMNKVADDRSESDIKNNVEKQKVLVADRTVNYPATEDVSSSKVPEQPKSSDTEISVPAKAEEPNDNIKDAKVENSISNSVVATGIDDSGVEDTSLIEKRFNKYFELKSHDSKFLMANCSLNLVSFLGLVCTFEKCNIQDLFDNIIKDWFVYYREWLVRMNYDAFILLPENFKISKPLKKATFNLDKNLMVSSESNLRISEYSFQNTQLLSKLLKIPRYFLLELIFADWVKRHKSLLEKKNYYPLIKDSIYF